MAVTRERQEKGVGYVMEVPHIPPKRKQLYHSHSNSSKCSILPDLFKGPTQEKIVLRGHEAGLLPFALYWYR